MAIADARSRVSSQPFDGDLEMKTKPLNKVYSYALKRKLKTVFEQNREKQKEYQRDLIRSHLVDGRLQ